MIKVIRATPEIQDRKDLKVILDRLVLLAHRDHKVFRVFKDRRVNKDQKVILVIMVFHLLLL